MLEFSQKRQTIFSARSGKASSTEKVEIKKKTKKWHEECFGISQGNAVAVLVVVVCAVRELIDVMCKADAMAR